MPATDDMELLREYATRGSEEAFAALVARHIDLVYSAALRHTRNHHQAQEITQAVFVVLARKAPSLDPRTVLAGWLFQTARLAAANYMRAEFRRIRREQEASMQANLDEQSSGPWPEVAPLLNDAIAGLREKDRNAIVLRFLQGKDYKAVAAALGGTEEAAQMRVTRALEKLRKLFAKRGVVLPAAALGGLLAAHGTQAAPAPLAAAVTAAATHGAPLAASTLNVVQGTLKLMAWTKMKLAVGATVVVLLAYQQHQNLLQAEQLEAARAALRARQEDAAAQQSQLRELQARTEAITDTRREQEQELARLRARRLARGTSPQSQAAGPAPSTLLGAALQDPYARQALEDDFLAGARKRWGSLVKELQLNPDHAQKLFQIGADWSMTNAEAVAAVTEGKLSPEAAVRAAAQTQQDATDQLRQLLGEEGLSRLEASDRSFPGRLLDEQFDHQLGFYHLSDEQRQQLRALVDSEPYEATTGLVGDFTVSQLVLPAEMERRLAQQQEVNQQILESAAAFLQPDQVEALQLLQQANQSEQQHSILRFLRRLRLDPMAPPVL
jgi:RNA polymerase sigma factor (sigma-70 family)